MTEESSAQSMQALIGSTDVSQDGTRIVGQRNLTWANVALLLDDAMKILDHFPCFLRRLGVLE